MAVGKTQRQLDQIYYCTFTCFRWIPLFEITNLYDFIYDWFDLLWKEEIKLIGYVLMPNHLHLMVYLPEYPKTINQILSNGKRFMAYEIVKRLKSKNCGQILKVLSGKVTDEEKQKGQIHRVFEPSSDIKPCSSRWFLEQKLDYIHFNPVSGKWKPL